MDSEMEWWEWPVWGVVCLVALPSLWVVLRYFATGEWHWSMLYKFWEMYGIGGW